MDVATDDLPLLTQKATNALQAGDFVTAEQAALGVLAQRPADLGMLHILGIALERQDRNADAAAIALRALELDPLQPDRYVRAATLMMSAGQLTEADVRKLTAAWGKVSKAIAGQASTEAVETVVAALAAA